LGFDGGYYVELGANDGISQSNTFFLEKKHKWHGLLIEPVPHLFFDCVKNRSVTNSFQCAAAVPSFFKEEFVRIRYADLMSRTIHLYSDNKEIIEHENLAKKYLKRNESIIEFGAVAKTLTSMLDECKAPTKIDFMSLDVEGSELAVLEGVDHEKYRFKYILIETRDKDTTVKCLGEYGYELVNAISKMDLLFASKW
jgi:FkbM family methyltransferase